MSLSRRYDGAGLNQLDKITTQQLANLNLFDQQQQNTIQLTD